MKPNKLWYNQTACTYLYLPRSIYRKYFSNFESQCNANKRNPGLFKPLVSQSLPFKTREKEEVILKRSNTSWKSGRVQVYDQAKQTSFEPIVVAKNLERFTFLLLKRLHLLPEKTERISKFNIMDQLLSLCAI